MIYVILGKTGAGKSTLFRELLKEKNLSFPRRFTTRPRRDGEVDLEYDFISEEQFSRLLKSGIIIAEHETENGWFYGVDSRTIDPKKNSIIITDMFGLSDLQKHYKEKVVPVYIHVPYRTREMRLFARGDDKKEMYRRLESDERDFKNILKEKNLLVLDGRSGVQIIRDEFLSLVY